ncbi:MAG: cell division protein FtsZ [Armatimonadetes bacterium]|nr:cell division protein FtsZ [Armatimonadota bacterium]
MTDRNVPMNPINLFETQAVIKVIGVGGAGCNAINRMILSGLKGVEFVAMNTDRQALEASLAPTRIALGVNSTRGLGTGGDPVRGEQAAKESEREIMDILEGADMVFVTAGMGGGTGTGAAPVVAELARRLDILTVGVVTKPFIFEGPRRKKVAQGGWERLTANVDTLILIANDKMMEVVDKGISMTKAFEVADDVLRQGVQGISDIITQTGMINVDFADVKSVMKDAGIAMMGMGRGIGDQRARVAAEAAANSPMLETSVVGAKKLLVNITAGPDFSIGEVREAMEYINQLADADDAEIFLGQVIDESLEGEVIVTLLAAGMSGTTPRPLEKAVFAEQPTVSPRTASVPVEAPANPRRIGEPINMDEIALDIPTFLRRQRTTQ